MHHLQQIQCSARGSREAYKVIAQICRLPLYAYPGEKQFWPAFPQCKWQQDASSFGGYKYFVLFALLLFLHPPYTPSLSPSYDPVISSCHHRHGCHHQAALVSHTSLHGCAFDADPPLQIRVGRTPSLTFMVRLVVCATSPGR